MSTQVVQAPVLSELDAAKALNHMFMTTNTASKSPESQSPEPVKSEDEDTKEVVSSPNDEAPAATSTTDTTTKGRRRRSSRPAVIRVVSTDEGLGCSACDESFATLVELRKHQLDAHNQKTFQCRRCGELFASVADRQTHKNNDHFGSMTAILKRKNFKEFHVGTTLTSARNSSGMFACPSRYCTFVTRIPQYWSEHVLNVEHDGTTDPQRFKKMRQS